MSKINDSLNDCPAIVQVLDCLRSLMSDDGQKNWLLGHSILMIRKLEMEAINRHSYPMGDTLIEKLESRQKQYRNPGMALPVPTEFDRGFDNALNEAIAIVRQHQAEQPLGSPVRYTDGTISREYDEQPVCSEMRDNASIVQRLKIFQDELLNKGNQAGWVSLLDEAIKAFQQPVPVMREPVSLMECVMALQDNQRIRVGSNLHAIAKAVLDAAGVKYVA